LQRCLKINSLLHYNIKIYKYIYVFTEYSTDIYTGSIYNDEGLLSILPAENVCNNSVSIIKVHPTYQQLYHGIFSSNINSCKKTEKYTFKKAILLYRDPYASIWSTYQYLRTNNHTHGIIRSQFNKTDFRIIALELSKKYFDMWNYEYPVLEQYYKLENLLYVKFEHLLSNSKKYTILLNMIKFIDFKHLSLNNSNYNNNFINNTNNNNNNNENNNFAINNNSYNNLLINKEKLDCAFKISEIYSKRKIHNNHNYIHIREVYKYNLVCEMWHIFGFFAKLKSYVPFNGFHCHLNNSIEHNADI
jgi:hypothetical protein